MCELIRIPLFLTFSQFDVWKKSDYFLTEKRAEAFPMRVQNMLLYIREYTLKSKEAVKPLGLRNIISKCNVWKTGVFTHTHTHTHARTHTHTHTRTHAHTHTHKYICTCTTTEENRRCRIFFKLQRF